MLSREYWSPPSAAFAKSNRDHLPERSPFFEDRAGIGEAVPPAISIHSSLMTS